MDLFAIKQGFVYSYTLIKNRLEEEDLETRDLFFFFFFHKGCLFIGLIFPEVKIHFEM